jgi:hypothetical protein
MVAAPAIEARAAAGRIRNRQKLPGSTQGLPVHDSGGLL